MRGNRSETLHLFMKNHSQRLWTFKHWSHSTGRLWIFFLSKNTHKGFCGECSLKMTQQLIQCQVKRRKPKNMLVSMLVPTRARSTQSVCLISVSLCILYIYRAVSVKWTLDISLPLQTYITHKCGRIFVCTLLRHLLFHDPLFFNYFLCYCIIFYTHILISMYIYYVFLNCLILLMFPIIFLLLFGMKVGL